MARAMNPIMMGILTGAASGAAAGAPAGPKGILIGAVIGATMGGITGSESQKADLNQKRAVEAEKDAQIQNQNALMEQEYNRKKQARGIDLNAGAAQTGAAMASPLGGNTNLLG